jgi:hypothetical protein
MLGMPDSLDNANRLLDLIQSHRITATIYVAAKLDLADLMRHGPVSLNDLVAATRWISGPLSAFSRH